MRLTQEIKGNIVNKAIADKYEPIVADMLKREHKLAQQCYNSVYTKSVRDAVAVVPEGWFRLDSCLRFNAGGYDVRLEAGEKYRTPHQTSCYRLGNIDGELADKVKKLVEEKKSTNDEANRDRTKLAGFLAQFNTFKQLHTSWPEGKKFYEKYDIENPVKAGVPAVITEEINSMLGIKPKKAKAV